MNKEFIPYELALELKRVGYDEPCFAWYNPKGTLLSDLTIGHEETDFFYTQNDMDENQCIAPTYSQAFRWFRENYGLSGWVNESFVGSSQGVISIKSEIGLKYHTAVTKLFDTYEEAELACLKKLIDIAK
jgi:hypothetical protein